MNNDNPLWGKYLNRELLRFATIGSVDDGKSTLIGRLLYDSKLLFDDQLQSIQKICQQQGNGYLDLALVTDGLKAEREQGITIDVAYRFFATPKRSFIIADTPGHIQYTRNMVTGISTAHLAVILVDARKGLTEQTKRHLLIASLLKIQHFIICVNKMDLVHYEENVYNQIVEEYKKFSTRLTIPDTHFIPISALHGDNLVEPSAKMPWYKGPSLMYILENVHISSDWNQVDCRFPVQLIIRPRRDEYHDYRGYAGRVASGVFKTGDQVMVLPSGLPTTIAAIDTPSKPTSFAFAPMSVTMRFTDDLDISRGDMIVRPNNVPRIGQDIDLMLCWLNPHPLNPIGKYTVKHTTRTVKCIVKDVRYKVDINALHRMENNKTIGMNDMGRVLIHTTQPLFYDSYWRNRVTGTLILIDENTNETVGVGMII